MQRFFFHLRNAHQQLLDEEGVPLADAAAAREQTERVVRDFFQPLLGRTDPRWEDWSIEVCDRHGYQTFRMAFADAGRNEDSPKVAGRIQDGKTVVDLNAVRLQRDLFERRRRLSELHQQSGNLIRHSRMLLDCSRYEGAHLYSLRMRADEIRARSRELMARSRHQTAVAARG
jgi:hypothetical protein